MKQTSLGTFFGGKTEKKSKDKTNTDGKSLAQLEGKDGSELKRSQAPSLQEVDGEFEINKTSKKSVELANTLFNVDLVPQKVNLINPTQAAKLNSIDSEDYRPKEDCVFSLKYVDTQKDKNDKIIPNFIPFNVVADAFDLIAEIKGTNSKGKKRDIITRLIRSMIIHAPNEVEELYMFSSCRLDADYIQPDLGIGKEIMIKSCAAILNIPVNKFRAGYKAEGDLGMYVEKNKSGSTVMANFLGTKAVAVNQGVPLAYIMKTLREISSINGSIAKSIAFGDLIKSITGNQAKYLIRYVNANLKIGANEKTFVEGLAVAFCEHYGQDNHEEWEKVVKKAINTHPNFRKIIRTALECKGDLSQISEKCKMTPGVPCKPMLAKPTKGISIIFKRFENRKFTSEFKYDGLRGQLHYKNGDVQLFSRNLENMTQTYPDILKLLKEKIDPNKVTSFIADSEIVAFDTQNKRILPFQTLMSRKKKDVKQEDLKVQVCLFVFDMIYLNGESLMSKSFRTRRTIMQENIPIVEGQLDYAKGMDSDDTDDIQIFLEESVKRKQNKFQFYNILFSGL